MTTGPITQSYRTFSDFTKVSSPVKKSVNDDPASKGNGKAEGFSIKQIFSNFVNRIKSVFAETDKDRALKAVVMMSQHENGKKVDDYLKKNGGNFGIYTEKVQKHATGYLEKAEPMKINGEARKSISAFALGKQVSYLNQAINQDGEEYLVEGTNGGFRYKSIQ